jgi:formylglycine-generating enzyme required for sulfatase activity
MYCHIPSGRYKLGVSAVEEEILRQMGLTFYTNCGVRAVFVRGFYIRTHLVSVREFNDFIEHEGGRYGEYPIQRKRLNYPAIVNHIWAERFAKSKGGRLPTAFEWEAAARGTDARPLPWGSEMDKRLIGLSGPPPIGAHPDLASPFGVQELVGWVGEWTSDIIDGKAIVKGTPYNQRFAHLADEAAYRRNVRMFNVGFRYVLCEP